MTTNQGNFQKEIPIPMTGTEVMKVLSVDAIMLVYLAKEEMLTPFLPKFHKSYLRALANSSYETVFDKVKDYTYRKSDVESFRLEYKKYLDELKRQDTAKNRKEFNRTQDDSGGAASPQEAVKNMPQETKSANYFIHEKGDYWRIIFDGKEVYVKNLVGLKYIAHLLARKGNAVNSIELVHAVNPPEDLPISKNRAEEEGLKISGKSRIVHKDKKVPETLQVLKSKYKELEADLNNAESDLEREEIRKEMKEIYESTVADKESLDPSNSKAQSGVKRNIKRAINDIERANMKDLADFLKKNIQPDGKYGYIYNGAPWEVTF